MLKNHSSLSNSRNRPAQDYQKSSDPTPCRRFFVPDLSPQARSFLKEVPIQMIFVGESPHTSEIEAEQLQQRRPLCGVAGRQWWSLLSELFEGSPNPDVTLVRQLKLSALNRFAVLNAVQYPMDPKIASVFRDADPVKNLGFGKLQGEYSYKKFKSNEGVKKALISLRKRLLHPTLRGAKIHCLGNDAQWLVCHTLTESEVQGRVGDKIPHPSAWWRQGGYFGRVAREKLDQILK